MLLKEISSQEKYFNWSWYMSYIFITSHNFGYFCPQIFLCLEFKSLKSSWTQDLLLLVEFLSRLVHGILFFKFCSLFKICPHLRVLFYLLVILTVHVVPWEKDLCLGPYQCLVNIKLLATNILLTSSWEFTRRPWPLTSALIDLDHFKKVTRKKWLVLCYILT